MSASASDSTVAAWSPPLVDGPRFNHSAHATTQSSTESQAWERGFAAGREAGADSIRAEHALLTEQLRASVQRVLAIIDHLARPLDELDEAVLSQLAGLAAAIATAVTRRELKAHPEAIIGLVRDTIKLLPPATHELRVVLHPEDAAVVRERLAEVSGERAWTILEDPVLTRGGCQLRSTDSTVDATVEQRIGEAIALALGDERGGNGRAA
jgi:flagellar assembly protein FliH